MGDSGQANMHCRFVDENDLESALPCGVNGHVE